MSDEHIAELKKFIFSQLREGDILDGTDEELDKKLFQTPSTLRLRRAGYAFLGKVYDHEKFNLEERLSGRELLTLKNHVAWPYFLTIDHKYIVLFTIKDSFFLKLQGGDVKKWLAKIYEKNSK